LSKAARGTRFYLPLSPLESVVVISRHVTVETLIDRKVYTVTSDVESTFGALSDVLTNIPSVNVDSDGTVSLRGDTRKGLLIPFQPTSVPKPGPRWAGVSEVIPQAGAICPPERVV